MIGCPSTVRYTTSPVTQIQCTLAAQRFGTGRLTAVRFAATDLVLFGVGDTDRPSMAMDQ